MDEGYQNNPPKAEGRSFRHGLRKIQMPNAYFFLAGAAVGLFNPAVANTFGFSFLGFLASLLDFS